MISERRHEQSLWSALLLAACAGVSRDPFTGEPGEGTGGSADEAGATGESGVTGEGGGAPGGAGGGSARCAVVSETWTGPNDAPWPSQWSPQITGMVTLSIQADQGEVHGQSDNARALLYPNAHLARDVDMVATFWFGENQAPGGFFAQLSDADPDTYLAVRFGALGGEAARLRIQAVVDDSPFNIATYPQTGLYQAQTSYRARFAVETNPAGSMNLRVRVWPADGAEPDAWTLESLDQVISSFQPRTGRFGVFGISGVPNRRVRFDDFTATACAGG